MTLRVVQIGPAVALQDLGRPGFLAQGLSRGGAADRLALYEGAALLAQDANSAAIEMVGFGGTFEALDPCCIALTGAEVRASVDGVALAWNASHHLNAGAQLVLGPTLSGTYGYLHVSGGFKADPVLGSRAAHLSVRLGQLVAENDLMIPHGGRSAPNRVLPRDDRFAGGVVRIVPSTQTHMFPKILRTQFEATEFRRDPRANRQAMRLDSDAEGFAVPTGLSGVSEIVTPGDIQITGDGTPYVLLAECQTTGGYPRIGTIIPSDLHRVVQTPAGESLRFQFVTVDEARSIEMRARSELARLQSRVKPLLRDPRQMDDLLAYNLVSGVVRGD